jgi:Stress responsive A/B Barrel Domain
MTLQHVVLFRFEPPLDTSAAACLRSLIADWPQEIGEFSAVHFGTDMHEVGRTRGYQYLLLTNHHDLESLRRYQAHPLHQQFSVWIGNHGGEVLAFDYELDRDTMVLGR